MRLCSFCRSLTRNLFQNPIPRGDWNQTQVDYFTFELLKETTLKESAKSCELCRMVYAFCGSVANEAPLDYKVYAYRSILQRELRSVSECELLLGSNRQRIHMAVWTDAGSRSTEPRLVSTLPPILDNNPEHNFPIVSTLLRECLACHEKCKTSISSEVVDDGNQGVQLPTRVLSIGSQMVRLIETNGMVGRYCALSHCWGPPERPPLRTTCQNLEQHLEGIPLASLPKTFREAVLLTSALGIDYLWIDSLCIIQDDTDDWLREAKLMGSLYGKAILVIAAAGSHDSSEGLLVANRPEPTTIELPYPEDDQVVGSFYLTLLPDMLQNMPSDGPLRQRGWCTQEWYLARRIVFCMPGGLTWRCREEQWNERGREQGILRDDSSWLTFLEEYSKSKLTYPTDRLVAIQGVVEAMQKTRYREFKYGVWEDSIIRELIWRIRDIVIENEALPALPSWCWASNGSEKVWCVHEHMLGATEVNLESRIHDTGVLEVSGNSKGCEVRAAAVRRCCIEVFTKHLSLFDSNSIPEMGLMIRRFENDISLSLHLLLDESAQRAVIGFAMFDRATPSSVICLFLVQIHRSSSSKLHPDYNVSPVDSDGDCHINTPDCVDFVQIGRGDCCYYALLLEPIDEDLKRYRRVGLGLLYGKAWDVQKTKVEKFQIL